MTCRHTLVRRNDVQIQWAFDGDKIFTDGVPLNIGLETYHTWGEGKYYWFVKMLSLFKYKVSNYTMSGIEEYSIDFKNKESKMDAYGVKHYANCYDF